MDSAKGVAQQVTGRVGQDAEVPGFLCCHHDLQWCAVDRNSLAGQSHQVKGRRPPESQRAGGSCVGARILLSVGAILLVLRAPQASLCVMFCDY